MRAGFRLRQIRERLGLTYRDEATDPDSECSMAARDCQLETGSLYGNRYDSKSFQVAPVRLMSLAFGLTKSRRSAACASRLDSSVR